MVARMLPQRLWVISSVGRASRLHREGRQFEPVITHQTSKKKPGDFRAFLFRIKNYSESLTAAAQIAKPNAILLIKSARL